MKQRVEPLIRTRADDDRMMWEYLTRIEWLLFGIAVGCLMLATSLEPGLAQTSGVATFAGLAVRWIKKRFRRIRYAEPGTYVARGSRAKTEVA